MLRIGLKQYITLPRQILYIFWKIGEAFPEPTRSSMHYMFRSFPLAFSVIASSIRKSNFPDAESSSICLSHCSQSLSTNHCLNCAYSSGEREIIADCLASTRDTIITPG